VKKTVVWAVIGESLFGAGAEYSTVWTEGKIGDLRFGRLHGKLQSEVLSDRKEVKEGTSHRRLR